MRDRCRHRLNSRQARSAGARSPVSTRTCLFRLRSTDFAWRHPESVRGRYSFQDLITVECPAAAIPTAEFQNTKAFMHLLRATAQCDYRVTRDNLDLELEGRGGSPVGGGARATFRSQASEPACQRALKLRGGITSATGDPLRRG